MTWLDPKKGEVGLKKGPDNIILRSILIAMLGSTYRAVATQRGAVGFYPPSLLRKYPSPPGAQAPRGVLRAVPCFEGVFVVATAFFGGGGRGALPPSSCAHALRGVLRVVPCHKGGACAKGESPEPSS